MFCLRFCRKSIISVKTQDTHTHTHTPMSAKHAQSRRLESSGDKSAFFPGKLPMLVLPAGPNRAVPAEAPPPAPSVASEPMVCHRFLAAFSRQASQRSPSCWCSCWKTAPILGCLSVHLWLAGAVKPPEPEDGVFGLPRSRAVICNASWRWGWPSETLEASPSGPFCPPLWHH